MTTTLTVRDPADVIAATTVVFGFTPEHSISMLTFGGYEPFHGRVDLPQPGEDVGQSLSGAAETLMLAAVQHHVMAAYFILYTDQNQLAAKASRALNRAFLAEGIEVIEVASAHDGRWQVVGESTRWGPRAGTYDISSHEFTAGAVFAGRQLRRSRADLANALAAQPDLVADVSRALAECPRETADASWVVEVVKEHLASGLPLETEAAAQLLLALQRTAAREAAFGLLDRQNAAAHVAFWGDLVRRSPGVLVTAPAAVLALSAWLDGNGALAWCALDRCQPGAPGSELAHLLEGLLERAVSPRLWEQVSLMSG